MRKPVVLVTVALTAVAAPMIAHAYAAAATPTPVPDNPTCTDHGFLQLTKFDPPSSGTATQDGVTITITGSHGDQATEFSWSSATPIDLVIVKAGNGANLYAYEEATADTDLVGPDGKGIGHISFCYDIEPPSPSPSPSPPPSPPPSPLS
jgi:hypothetical protein